MSVPTYLLDTSFLIDFVDEVEAGKPGPAMRALESLPAGRLFLSAVTVAEMLEGAEDAAAMLPQLAQYHFQPLGWATAQRCALNQLREARRMGENDAW
ncbi:MAG TPA: type II toxin-antitoxin system VapC family toxin, partial [Opitutaceae bacterium]